MNLTQLKQGTEILLASLLAIFSTPPLALADCGPQVEGCKECGPHWTEWYAEYCPSLSATNHPSVDPTSFGCAETGKPPPQPAVTPPAFAPGRKVRYGWYDCSTDTVEQHASVTYTVGGVYWDPGLPAEFGLQHVGTFHSSAFVYLTSSFSEHCPSVPYYIGSCSWNVIDARETLVMTINFNEGAQYFGTLLGILKDAATIGGCTGSDPSLFGSIAAYRKSVCCTSQSGPYMESRVEGSITAGWPEIDCPIPACSIAVPGGFAGVGLFLTAGFSGTATASTGVAQPCETQPIYLHLELEAHLGLKAQAYVELPAHLIKCSVSASGTASSSVSTSGPDSEGKCHYNLAYGTLTANVVVTVQALGGMFACEPYSAEYDLWEGLRTSGEIGCIQLY